MVFLTGSISLATASGGIEAFYIGGTRMFMQAGPECAIVRVIDGQTLRVHCHETGFERARLEGILTPEIFSPDCFGELAAGYKSRWRLQMLYWNANLITFRFGGRDEFGRLVTQVNMDGINAAQAMVRSGHAYTEDSLRRNWCR